METKSISEFREPYVRGPHFRYFITAMVIAFFVVAILLVGFVLFMRLIFPLD
jgi:hypothetical protein